MTVSAVANASAAAQLIDGAIWSSKSVQVDDVIIHDDGVVILLARERIFIHCLPSDGEKKREKERKRERKREREKERERERD